MKQYFYRLGLCLVALYYGSSAQAQFKLTLDECERLFRKNNLQLLASQYQVNEAQAALVQSKIWDQPTLTLDVNAINPQHQRLFDIGSRGQKAIQIQQLIYWGGKKRHEIALNQTNIEQSKLIYEDDVRHLLFELRTAYYDIHFSDAKIARISNELEHIDTLLKAYQVQEQKGNISLKEMVRLQSLSFSLRNELLAINNDRVEQMAKIQLICGIDTAITTQLDEQETINYLLKKPLYPLQTLIDTIKQNNPSYLWQVKEVENKSRYLAWQKSLNKPDLYVGSSYDQRGGAFNNQVNLNVTMSIPFWQKNKGNIQVAQAAYQKSDLLKSYAERDLGLQVQTLLKQLGEHQQLFRAIEETDADVKRVYEGILNNFQKRNISLLEFTDFIESYNERLLNLQELKKQILQQQQWLNYLANKNVF